MARRPRVPLVVAALVGVVLLAGLAVYYRLPAAGRDDCVPLAVTASSEKADLLKTLLETDYAADGRTFAGDRCARVTVTSQPSGEVEQALEEGWPADDTTRPDVWSPAASTWVALLQHRLRAAGRPDVVPAASQWYPIARSPLVIAMPEPMARAFGWPQREIGWGDLAALARDPAGWSRYGHAEWGAFKLGKTNPTVSTSGLHATLAAFAAAGASSDGGLTTEQLEEPARRTTVRDVESSVVHYGDTTLAFLQNLYDATRAGGEGGLDYISAVAVEEKSVWDYNQGNPSGSPTAAGLEPPAVPLVAIHPKDGTLVSDNPFVTLSAAWVTQDKRDAAADVLAFLREGPQQQRFKERAFRDVDGAADPAVVPDAPPADRLPVIPTPDGAVLDEVRSTWEELKKPANLLIVLDVSGSMNKTDPGSGGTRLALAERAVRGSLDLLGNRDRVGLWAFDDLPTQELVPIDAVGRVRTEFDDAFSRLEAGGDTALYRTTREAADRMTEGVDRNRRDEQINAVVVLTDGVNEYPADDDRGRLERDLRDRNAASGVRVFTIAYGPDAGRGALEAIARAGSATSYDASRTVDIDTVMTNVIANF